MWEEELEAVYVGVGVCVCVLVSGEWWRGRRAFWISKQARIERENRGT